MWGQGGAYADWSHFLEDWSRAKLGVDAIPNVLEQADFAPDTWVRLLTRVQDAVQERLNRWNSQLSAALAAAPDEFATGRALTQSRVGLRAIRELCLQPGLPEDLRARLVGQIDQQVRSLQTTLEQQARDLRQSGDSKASEMLLRALRDRLDVVTATTEVPIVNWSPIGGRARRRVVLDVLSSDVHLPDVREEPNDQPC
jgi:hypothetical protein